MPATLRNRQLVTEYIKIAVIGAHFEEFVILPVPMVQHFFHQMLASVQPKTNRPFVGCPSGIAFDF